MIKIPILYAGDSIHIKASLTEPQPHLFIDGMYAIEFDSAFDEMFGSGIVPTVHCKVLVNNIVQDIEPEVVATDSDITIQLDRELTKLFQKGLLEIELLLTYTIDGEDKHLVRRAAVGWLKYAHTATV